MKFLVDMNLSPLWVQFLGEAGFAAIHWSVIGQSAATDREIIEFAAGNGYIVFTHDLDFGTLLASQAGLALIQIRSQDVLPEAVGEIVLRAIRAAQSHLEIGALVTVDPVRHRIRLLPI